MKDRNTASESQPFADTRDPSGLVFSEVGLFLTFPQWQEAQQVPTPNVSSQASPTQLHCPRQPSELARCRLKPTLSLLQLKHIILKGLTSLFPQINFPTVGWSYSSVSKGFAQHTRGPENHINQSWWRRVVCNPRH